MPGVQKEDAETAMTYTNSYDGPPEVTHYWFGWIVQGRYCTGGGRTKEKAIEAWIVTVTNTLSSGGYYTKQARKEARKL